MTTPSRDDWLNWMRDFAAAAAGLTGEEDIVIPPELTEVTPVKMALYARALGLFEGSMLLIENERQLDFRIQSRAVIEASIYLIALDNDPTLIDAMKEDDLKSRLSRAQLHLKAQDFNGSPEVRKLLEDFIADGSNGAKPIKIAGLLEGNEFERLYRTYRNISADAAHVSMTALSRHFVRDEGSGRATLIIDPELDALDLHLTFSELCIAMIIATFMLMKIKTKSDLWDEIQSLTRRYKAFSSPDDINENAVPRPITPGNLS